MQKPQARLGPRTLATAEEQLVKIKQLQEEVEEVVAEGRELIFIDECIFSSKSGRQQQWAPSGNPLEWDSRFWDDDYIAVCGGCSLERGLVHTMCLEKQAYSGESFRQL